MNPFRLVVIGGVAGGASPAARARRLSEDASIVVLERGPYVSFANCGLPYHVGGEIAARDALLLQTPESLRARFNLDVRARHEALSLDRARRTVRVRDLAGGREYDEPYDALILATGAVPVQPSIPGLHRDGHFHVRTIPDTDAIHAWLQTRPVRHAVVVGGGYIGLEMTEQLHRRGLEVTLVEALPQVLAPLDPEMAAWLHAELRALGVALHLGDPVAAFEPPAAGETAAASTVVLRSGTRLPADLVILGLGVKPEVTLVRAAGLELGDLGGLRVDAHLRTSDPAIWAVGDAIEVQCRVTRRWQLILLAGPANRQGRIAADNIFGRPATYEGTLGTAVLRLFRLTAACTGVSETTLRRKGRPHQALHLHPASLAGYYPGAEPLALKILFDPDSGALLGAQAVGREGVDKRMGVVATALRAGFTLHDLADLELCYAPPFSSAKDPVNLAGMAARNVLRRDVRLAQCWELLQTDPARTVVLDVRSVAERAAGYIFGSLHIPLPELRARLHELLRDKEIVVSCQSGQRSYFTCRLLAQRGFQVRNLTGSFRTWLVAPRFGTCG